MGLERTAKYTLIVIVLLFFYLTVGFELIFAGVQQAMGYLQQSGLTTIQVPYQTYDPSTGSWTTNYVQIDVSSLMMFTITALVFFLPILAMLYYLKKI